MEGGRVGTLTALEIKISYLAKADCSGARRRFLRGEEKAENAEGLSFTGDMNPACSEPGGPPFRAGEDARCNKSEVPEISPAQKVNSQC